MVVFFKKGANTVYAVETTHKFSAEEAERLTWLFDGASPLASTSVKGTFIGPRKEMITPWSTNAVEITQNMGLEGITRIEEFTRVPAGEEPVFDKMLSRLYPDGLNSKVYTTSNSDAPIVYIDDISEYTKREGLALSPEEEQYLRELSERLGRP
ncbi:MAG: phosphoribosylformylglycinamidine synthase, partial [Duncaniella sp.]|nr:phosphoribosylformylglycinamidine synthase [Duncaniella sp.]